MINVLNEVKKTVIKLNKRLETGQTTQRVNKYILMCTSE